MKHFSISSFIPKTLFCKAAMVVFVMTASQSAFAASCEYEVVDEWDAGYKAEISIINNGDPITDWALSSNAFVADANEPAALSGSITDSGEVVFAIDLNDVSTGVDIRNSRLMSILFETDLLPTAYFRTNLDVAALAQMPAGSTRFETVSGEFSLHAVRQTISADLLIIKKSASEILVSTVKPINIHSESFDMAAGIEALRVVANLSSIGEAVPVYLQLNYVANTNAAVQPVAMPLPPEDPSDLIGDFDAATTQTSLSWLDNSDNETAHQCDRRQSVSAWRANLPDAMYCLSCVERGRDW